MLLDAVHAVSGIEAHVAEDEVGVVDASRRGCGLRIAGFDPLGEEVAEDGAPEIGGQMLVAEAVYLDQYIGIEVIEPLGSLGRDDTDVEDVNRVEPLGDCRGVVAPGLLAEQFKVVILLDLEGLERGDPFAYTGLESCHAVRYEQFDASVDEDSVIGRPGPLARTF